MNYLRSKIESALVVLGNLMVYGRFGAGDIFNHWHKGQEKSATLRNIYRDVYGADYDDEVEPGGYVGLSELHYIADHLKIEKGQALIDLGCGRGGPGLWIAKKTKCFLTGIDLSEVAVSHCKQRTMDFNHDTRTDFQVGDVCNTGKPDSSYDGAISIDTFVFVPDKLAALNEVKRILRPDARFVFTSWEADYPFMIRDYRNFMQKAGLEVEEYYEVPNWKQKQLDVYAGILAAKKSLIQEMGKKNSKPFIMEARRTAPMLDRMRRVLLVTKNIK